MAAKFLNIILVLAVLSSSTGLVLGKHSCQQMAKAHVQPKNCCSAHKACDDGCCKTDFKYFQLDQDQQAPTLGLDLPTCPAPLATPLLAQLNGLSITDHLTLRYLNYQPPIVRRDIPSLFQFFRC